MTPPAITRNARLNPGLMPVLGLCPLLVVSTSLSAGVALGIATLLVLCVSGALASLMGRRLQPEARAGILFVIAACAISSIELLTAAWAPRLNAQLGTFLPLIVSSCLVLAHPDALASAPRVTGLRAAARLGVRLLFVLSALGAFRELLGHGTLGDGLGQWVGVTATAPEPHVAARDGLLLATLPAGAFVTLGVLLALHRLVSPRSREARTDEATRA